MESFSDKIVVRWQSTDVHSCGIDDAVFTAETMGGEAPLSRAFALSLAAVASVLGSHCDLG